MKLPPCPTYKPSGVEWLGDVPQTWKITSLRYVLAQPITDGPHLTPEFVAEGVPFLSVDGIQDGELVFTNCRFVSEEDHAWFVRKVWPQRGDILMGKAASTGKIARVKVDFEFSIWSPLALIRTDRRIADSRFTEYALKSKCVQSQIDVLCTHNTQSNISMDDIPRILFAMPVAVPDQCAISDFLDRETAKIDTLVEKKRTLIERLKEKRTALISRTVTRGLPPDDAHAAGLEPHPKLKPSGIDWLGDVPEHWEVKRVKHICRIRYGLGEPPEYADDGVPFVRATDINRGKIDLAEVKTVSPMDVPWSRRPQLDEGEILVVRSGAYTGDSAIVTDAVSGCIAGYDMVVTPREAHPAFVGWGLLSKYLLESQIHLARLRAAQPHLNAEELGGFTFLAPPRPEQEYIADFLDRETAKIDRMIAKVETAIERLQEYRTALITAAVTGKVDVRETVV